MKQYICKEELRKVLADRIKEETIGIAISDVGMGLSIADTIIDGMPTVTMDGENEHK